MADRDIRMRVGASIDSSFTSVMREVVSTTQKVRKQIAKEAASGAKDGVKAVKDGEKQKEKFYTTTADIARVMANRMAKDVEKAAKDRVRSEKEAMREVERDLKAHNRARIAEAKAAAKEEARIAKEAAKQGGFSKFMNKSRSGGIALRGASAALHGVTRMAGGFLRGIGVDTSMQGQFSGAMTRDQQAINIANEAWMPEGGPKSAKRRVDPNEIQQNAFQTAQASGLSTDDVQTGIQKFVSVTGDLKTAQDSMMEIGKLAKANGTDFGEMMEAAAAIANSMGDIENKGPLIAAAMKTMAGQGQLGAITIKNMAKNMGFLSAQANNFKIDPLAAKTLNAQGVTNDSAQRIAVVGALAQYARRKGGMVTAKTAMASAMSFTRDLSNANEVKRMSAVGLNPFQDAGKTQVRDPVQMALEIFSHARSKGGVDLAKINNLVPNQRSRAVVNAMGQDYNAAYRKSAELGITEETKKHQYAMEAVTKGFLEMLQVTQSDAETAERFGIAMNTAGSQATLLNNELGNAAQQIIHALTPALIELVPTIRQLGPAIMATIDILDDILPGRVSHQTRNQGDDAILQAAQATTAKLKREGKDSPVMNQDTFDEAHEREKALNVILGKRQGDKYAKDDYWAAYLKNSGNDAVHQKYVAEQLAGDKSYQENLKAIEAQTKALDELRHTFKDLVQANRDYGTGTGTRVPGTTTINGVVQVDILRDQTSGGAKPKTAGTTSADSQE